MIKEKESSHSLDLNGVGAKVAEEEITKFIEEHKKEDCELTIIVDKNNESVHDLVMDMLIKSKMPFTWTGQNLNRLIIWPKD